MPEHNPDTCAWKAGRWECLHAVDADHFWIGDLLVDLNQLRHEEESLNEAERSKGWRGPHGRRTALYMLENYARDMLSGNWKLVTPDKVKRYLVQGNSVGLHTGYVGK